MFPVEDAEILRKYDADVIAWGAQLPWPSDSTIGKRIADIRSARSAGVKHHAVDFALIQEGTRYLARTVGLWDLDDLNGTALKPGQIETLKDHAVLDCARTIVGVPWNGARWTPMACTLDPGYRRWLLNRIDALMSTAPDMLHVDEPLAGAEGLHAKHPGCFCDRCCAAFRAHLRNGPEAVWRRAGIREMETFNYRDFVAANGGAPRKAPLWDEFGRFQGRAASDLLKELLDRARRHGGDSLRVGANAHPAGGRTLPLMPLLDYTVVELRHRAERLAVPDDPILAYKMGDSLGVPVFATALGDDWARMIKEPHPVLVSAWIAQAYAFGHWMMMPHNAWSPTGRYLPPPEEYAGLAAWIRKKAGLLDGYREVSTTALVVSASVLNDENDKDRLVRLCGRLCRRGVPFHIVLAGGGDAPERPLTPADFQGAAQTIVPFPRRISSDEMSRIRDLAGNGSFLPMERDRVGGELPATLAAPVRVKGAGGIIALPRRRRTRSGDRIVVHLLNREYDPQARAMKRKGPFTVGIDRALTGGTGISGAVLHLPPLPGDAGDGSDRRIPLKARRSPAADEITVPSLAVWGILELTETAP